MMLAASFLNSFSCLGDACEDTCCKGWGMQVDAGMVQKYQAEAPELLEVVTSGEAEHIMRRDPQTDYCVKFEAGWCGIHRERGTEFLGDACHFFPRITRKLGAATLQTASLSCPEVARLALLKADAFAVTETEAERLPYSLKDYLPAGMEGEAALGIHQAFLNAVIDETATPEHILCKLHSVAQSLEALDKSQWQAALPFYLKSAEGRLPAAEKHPADMFNLFYALVGLIAAAPTSKRPRLEAVVASIAQALGLDTPQEAGAMTTLNASHLARMDAMQTAWKSQAVSLQNPLKRWIQAQLSVACFPFAGFGNSLSERVAMMAIRFATLKLALMAELAQSQTISDEAFIRITQSLARFMDHLADPAFSVQIYTETGWLKPARLRGLLGV